MKKRKMKKYIPRDTIYCGNCPWRTFVEFKKLHRDTGCEYADECNCSCWSTHSTSCHKLVYRCEYLGYTDFDQDSLLWDGCKECGE